MDSLKECMAYVRSLVRRRTRNYAQDVREDILADAQLRMVEIWPDVKKPVTKLYLQQTFNKFHAKRVNRYLDPVHIPQRYRDRGITTEADLSRLSDQFPKISKHAAVAVTHALSGVETPFMDPFVDPAANPEEKAADREILTKILACLTPHEYALLVAVAVEEHSLVEIAEREGVTRQAIFQQIEKIKKKVRQQCN